MDVNEIKKKLLTTESPAIKNYMNNFMENAPRYSRFNKFIETHNLTDEYSVRDLSRWHMILTASCAQGRSDFAKEHNLDFNKTKMTVPEFFELVKGHYGGDVIERLEAKMKAAEKLKSTK